ncbi:MAG: hypothetical protein WA843_05110 [Candidatus Saccharimonadales bacterium]
MKRTKSNQKGFSLVEGLLIVIAVALIAFVGYYVWHSQKEANKTLNAASKSSQATTPKADTKPTTPATADEKEAQLQTFMLATCSASDNDAIKALFQNQSVQNVDTDNIKIDGNYAVANIDCTLHNNTKLSTEFFKYTGNKWALSFTTSTELTCDFLTGQGVPDSLKAPYCSNSTGEQQQP